MTEERCGCPMCGNELEEEPAVDWSLVGEFNFKPRRTHRPVRRENG